MSELTAQRSSAAAAEDPWAAELPWSPAPTIPLWCENYFHHVYDPASEVGVLMHLGSRPHDARLWRELLVVHLPDGRLAVAKGFARPDISAGPGGPTLEYRCVQPFGRWAAHFDGMARITEPDELFEAPLRDGVWSPLELQLESTDLAPAVPMGDGRRTHTWGQAHYQCHQRSEGSAFVDDTTYRFAGNGIRDHTRGPRNHLGIGSHAWITATFPSGRAIAAVEISTPDGSTAMRQGQIHSSGSVQEVSDMQLPRLHGLSTAGDDFEFTIAGEQGRGRVLYTMPFTLMAPNENILGIARHQTDALAYLESVVEVEFGGEHGWGLLERTQPMPAAVR